VTLPFVFLGGSLAGVLRLEWEDLTMTDSEDEQPPVEISADELGDSQLTDLIKEYISPEYATNDLSPEAFQSKERLARKQLSTGSLKIIYDASSDTTLLMTSQDWRKVSLQFGN
jgi:hypothetical protein